MCSRLSRTIRSRRPAFSKISPIPQCTSWSRATRTIPRTGGFPIAPVPRPCCAAPALRSPATPRKRSISAKGEMSVVEAVMLWNEPNNLSHWNFEIDPGWTTFSQMVNLAADAVRAERPNLRRVLGGISPIDAGFISNMQRHCVLSHVNVVALHGFPLDWNHWTIHEWPQKLEEIRAVTDLPLWISEVGVSTFGAEEVQQFGLKRTAELLIGRAERIHWYSLYDLPRAWPATTRHREAEGSSYYRHFYMGLF